MVYTYYQRMLQRKRTLSTTAYFLAQEAADTESVYAGLLPTNI
jgi:hypothetical protein